MKITGSVYIRGRIHDLKHGPGNQIPIIGQREKQHRLKLQVYNVAIRLVQPVGIFLKLERPDARNLVRQFLVNLVERFAVRRLSSCRDNNCQR